jgi:hypothetical protein
VSALERRIITPFEQTTYGIVSGAHRAPFNAILAIYALADKGVDAIILNGDIGDVQYRVQGRDQVFDRNATQRFTQMILHAAVMTGLPVYVQPGSHERIDSYGYVVDELAKECPNLINVLEPDNGLILKGDHQLLFLPGSDVRAGGEYGFHVDEERQTGRYFIRTPEFGSRWIHKDRLGHTYSFDGAIEFERFKTKGI